MFDGGARITLGALIDSGLISVTTGFPFGDHNDASRGAPHIRPFNVHPDGRISLSQIKSIPIEAAAGKPSLKRNDILFNNTNTKELVGKCALWDMDKECVFSNHMSRIRVLHPSLEPAYLSFAILHHWHTGKSEMLARAHVAQASIIGERFREIEVTWRDRHEQRLIAEVLSLVQHSIKIQDAQIDNANDLKRACMRQLVTRGLHCKALKESEIGAVPEHWEVVQLGSLGRVGNGSTPKKSIQAYWQDGTYPWLTSAKVYDRRIARADQFVTAQALDRCHLPRLKPGSVLIAITGQGKTLGHCATLEFEATINQHLAYVATDTARADPSFVRGYLETRYDYLRQVASGGGSTKGALTCAFLRTLPIPFPPLEEQREIAAVLNAIDRKLEIHAERRGALQSLFRSLLSELMATRNAASGLNGSASQSSVMPEAVE
jgi:type I restriction enzyme, S subunit